MSTSRITSWFFSRAVLSQCRNSPFFFGRRGRKYGSSFTNQLLFPSGIHDKVSLLHHSVQNSSAFQWFGFSSSTSPQPNERKTAQSGNAQENKANCEAASAVDAPDQTEASISGVKTEPDLEIDLSRDDLVKLVVEKEQLLDSKQEELEKMKDKVLRSLAEMENVKERTRRESENAKKFAFQNFAKSLLDVADNLGRASSAARESFSNFDASKNTDGTVKQLKTLLEGVEMTEKQLPEVVQFFVLTSCHHSLIIFCSSAAIQFQYSELFSVLKVFKKFGLEKYDPINEEFDPNRHNAVFQVPDASRPADHVAVVLKAGYMLHEQVIRPVK
ncbi:UNVERIFIED_CONTAM: GrpE protein2, mitochondrial [Sesamum radiatum]|uniref:GrpE protein2, mitochondrial n=1 Tax=Sesamum radiatum TaxID=300843 RepID=A0AAW2T6B4_SESRA